MSRHYLFGILVLVACSLLEVSTYPSNNEVTTTTEAAAETPEEKDERSLTYDESDFENEEATKEIIKKIAAINEALKKPSKRPQFQWNTPPPPPLPQNTGGYVFDKDTLEKLQQVIASGKLHPYPSHVKQQDSNALSSENIEDMRYSRQISPMIAGNQLAMTGMPAAYLTNMPVLVMPSANNMYGQHAMEVASQYQTKEGPTSPFQPFQPFQPGQFQWPFAPLFPILIRDPLLSIMNGGGFQNFIEYGQSADVCKRRQKSDETADETKEEQDLENAANILLSSSSEGKSRKKRAVKKRTVNQGSQLQDFDADKVKKFFSIKPTTTTAKPLKQEPLKGTKTTNSDESEGDLRFPFLFAHKEKPSGPGFFINRLKVRRGGVAIAGPGGVATAGRGGTAIVGPGGLAYTQPGGIAVAGPAARVIALSSDADLTSVASRLLQQSTIDGSVPQLLRAIPEGRLWSGYEHRKGTDVYRFNGVNFQKAPLNLEDTTFMLFIRPVAHAKSLKGTAIANPISQVIIAKDKSGTIVHAPVATAVVGPGGIAHAQSDLYLASVQYLPFYGGGRGQYLEIKKDTSGRVTSEKIVSEENISGENIVKNSDENLLTRVMAANLQKLRSLSTSLLKLTNLGRKTGTLGNTEKARFKTQLASLGEAASNIIKLIEEVDDVDVLFKKNVTLRKAEYEDEDDDYVAEEGVGIEASSDDGGEHDLGAHSLIAEAKPVGLAIVGEKGIAASRPQATAVAAHGIAIARPMATAVAGVNPSNVGLDLQLSQYTKKGIIRS
ncbi:uncharacterized protein LOC142972765 [Anticarsia gemmatalis]|uniref:uncharacterized protein LOC142972765 n=1 Tax=Anticarsia gemmatalis TaxID=129554 RepID=UPI003F76F79E